MQITSWLKKSPIKHLFKWIIIPLALFALASAFLYLLIEPKQNRNWTAEHALLPTIEFNNDKNNPDIRVKNIRDFY